MSKNSEKLEKALKSRNYSNVEVSYSASTGWRFKATEGVGYLGKGTQEALGSAYSKDFPKPLDSLNLMSAKDVRKPSFPQATYDF